MQFNQQRRPRPLDRKEAIQRLSNYKTDLYRHRQNASGIAYNFRADFLKHLADIESKVDSTLRGLQNFFPWMRPDQGEITKIQGTMFNLEEEFKFLSERTAENVDRIVVDMDNLPGLEDYLRMPDLPMLAAHINPAVPAVFTATTQAVASGHGHVVPFTNSTAFSPAMQTNQVVPYGQNIIQYHQRRPSQSTSDLLSVAPWLSQGSVGHQPAAGPSNPQGRMYRQPSFQENYLPFAGGEGDQNIIRRHHRQPSQSTSNLLSVVAPNPWTPQGYVGDQPVAGPSNPQGQMHRYPSSQGYADRNYLPSAEGENTYTADEYTESISSEHSSEHSTKGLLRHCSKGKAKRE